MKYIILFTVFFFILTSCSKETVDIPDIGRKIIINGLLTTDTLLNVRIAKSFYVNDITGDNYISRYNIDSAEVCFYQDNIMIDSLHYVYNEISWDWSLIYGNYWSQSIYLLPGKEYKVVVKASGLPYATASMTIPQMVRIEHMDTIRIILAPGAYYESNVGLQCKIEFSDPKDKENYYMFKISRLEYQFTHPYYTDLQFKYQDPVVEEEFYTPNGLEGIAFSDKLINGQKHSLNVIVKGESIGIPFIHLDRPESSYPNNTKTIIFRLYSITGDYFRFIQTLNLYEKNYKNPLTEPVQVYSNVNGGYGIFAGAALSNDSLIFNY
jgi:hypothetical protein